VVVIVIKADIWLFVFELQKIVYFIAPVQMLHLNRGGRGKNKLIYF